MHETEGLERGRTPKDRNMHERIMSLCTYQTYAVDFHGLLRELVRDGKEIPGNLDRVLERKRHVIRHAAHQPLTDTKLPGLGSEPLLSNADLHFLRFAAFEICGHRFGKLRLNLCYPCSADMCVVHSIPDVDEGVVDDFEHVDHEFESNGNWSVGRDFV